jgi:predicted Fe-Mo cluster-binding NifX family protein
MIKSDPSMIVACLIIEHDVDTAFANEIGPSTWEVVVSRGSRKESATGSTVREAFKLAFAKLDNTKPEVEAVKSSFWSRLKAFFIG